MCYNPLYKHENGTNGGITLRTIETGRAIVDIIVWPEDRPWKGRYQTSSQIEQGICKLVLSPGVFRDTARANTAYRRFAHKIAKEGLEPPNVIFTKMVSNASQNVFCVLSTTQSVFNTGCKMGRMVVIESGIDDKRRLCAVRVDHQRACV